jgi:ketosteroid isomerase-like protein
LGQAELWKLELMLEDRASNNAIERGGPSSYSTFFTPNGSVIRPGVGEIQGREAIHEAFMADIYSGALVDLNWSPERAEVSRGGDQGYTVGVYWAIHGDSAGVETSVRGKYVRYWARQPDQSWKVEMELRNPVAAPEMASGPTSGNGPDDSVP